MSENIQDKDRRGIGSVPVSDVLRAIVEVWHEAKEMGDYKAARRLKRTKAILCNISAGVLAHKAANPPTPTPTTPEVGGKFQPGDKVYLRREMHLGNGWHHLTGTKAVVREIMRPGRVMVGVGTGPLFAIDESDLDPRPYNPLPGDAASSLNMIAALDALRDRMDAKRKEEEKAKEEAKRRREQEAEAAPKQKPPGHRYQLTFRQVEEEAGKPCITVENFRIAFRRYFPELAKGVLLYAAQFSVDFAAGTITCTTSGKERA